MLNEKVGKNLRRIRLINNYSQEAVEIGVNLSRSTLSRIENGTGRIGLDKLERFAEFFKVDVVTIISMSDDVIRYSDKIAKGEVSETVVDYTKTDVELAKCKEKLSALKKEVSYLKQEVALSKSQIKDKDLIIKLLSKD